MPRCKERMIYIHNSKQSYTCTLFNGCLDPFEIKEAGS